MIFKLPLLPYKYESLEPYIDKETMLIHHTKHHQAYVDNLNKALLGENDVKGMQIEEILENIDKLELKNKQAVINHGGGHVNHSFFWETMSPQKSSPSELTKKILNSEFGSLEKFKISFSEKAMGVFGSGWAFWVVDKNKKHVLKRQSFQNSPLMGGSNPILGIDVWEHAYYLKYQNKRAEYIEAWWNVVNWDQVERNLKVISKAS